MSEGLFVEALTSEALAAGEIEHPYTQRLLSASRGYDRMGAAV